MSITFKKRQKEMKRQEKQRAKAERREQKKVARRAAKEAEALGGPTAPEPELQLEQQDGTNMPDDKSL